MTSSATTNNPFTPARWVTLIFLGLIAGFLSGMFGVGGGILIVPGLVLLVGFSQRLASGTSLAAIIPLAAVGVTSYAVHDSVSWIGAIVLAAGAMGGAKLGTWILARIRLRPLQIAFSALIVVAIISLFLVIPSRDATLTLTWISAIGLLGLGFLTGVLSGLLGIGGGIVVVPALMLLFGVSDLVAKGTSLLMMIPAALVGTIANWRVQNVNLTAAAAVGIPACLTTFLGSRVATLVSPTIANITFAVFLSLVAAQLLWTALRAKDKPAGPGPEEA